MRDTSAVHWHFSSADHSLRYASVKHWFQDEQSGGAREFNPKSSIVLVLFRDPFDWVDAMREVSWLTFSDSCTWVNIHPQPRLTQLL